MSLETFEQKRDSLCEHDARKHHFWVSKGVTQYNGTLYEVFRCTQCKKVITEPLEHLVLK